MSCLHAILERGKRDIGSKNKRIEGNYKTKRVDALCTNLLEGSMHLNFRVTFIQANAWCCKLL